MTTETKPESRKIAKYIATSLFVGAFMYADAQATFNQTQIDLPINPQGHSQQVSAPTAKPAFDVSKLIKTFGKVAASSLEDRERARKLALNITSLDEQTGAHMAIIGKPAERTMAAPPVARPVRPA